MTVVYSLTYEYNTNVKKRYDTDVLIDRDNNLAFNRPSHLLVLVRLRI